MKHTTHFANVGFLAMALAVQAPLAAQQIVLSEIRADGEDWLEIHNRGIAQVDLSSWSIYYATNTQYMPGHYWWPFPDGTVIEPGEFMRVFWYQEGSSTPGEFYTGTTVWDFLFYLGGEQLRPLEGAFALVDTQESAAMGTASHFVDWVSWGVSGLEREDLAVQNGTWSEGRHAPSIPSGQSLARNEPVVGRMPTRDAEWFLDATPTPMAPNTTGMAVLPYGQSCAVPGNHLVGRPMLRTTSLPLLGNAQFGFVVENTTGFFGETMMLAFSTAAGPNGQVSLLPPFPGASCREAIHTGQIVAGTLMSTRVMQTGVSMSLAHVPSAMAGLEFHAQAVVFDMLPNAYPPYQGISNALLIVVGQ